MMTTFHIKKFIKTNLRNRKAITFVEVMICIIVASLVFGVIYNFMSNTNRNYMYGVVNLQNLQEARLAINYLRRDFASSCPMLIEPDEATKRNDKKRQWYVDLQKTRYQLFANNNNNNNNDNNCLIQVFKDGLLFYKFKESTFKNSGDYHPVVEMVTYQFNAAAKTLTRKSNSKGTTVFTGFEDVSFSLYTHELNPNIPLLCVKIRVNESSNMYGSNKIGTPLEITTTISSNFINSSQKNKYWCYETGFRYE